MPDPSHRRKTGVTVDDVSRREVEAECPMPSVIVVSRDFNLPSPGHFELGPDLRLVRAGLDDMPFAVHQISRVVAA